MKKRPKPSPTCRFCFVGISGKPGPKGTMKALSEETLSGRIISKVEAKLRAGPEGSTFRRDNLVRKPPMANGKLRYPNFAELSSEWHSFEDRLVKMKANIVILLGGIVSEFFKERRQIREMSCSSADGRLLKWAGLDNEGLIILAVAHPSYVGVYARKQIEDYSDLIFRAVSSLKNQLST